MEIRGRRNRVSLRRGGAVFVPAGEEVLIPPGSYVLYRARVPA
ncbi:MAG: hypothetical protein BWY88_00591 [Synergistetes bacterium ADurb.Bin520]|nr:MAG: hypothetical protein BWY88_00591 [Synergistetes bacterium ADurb.Bin520]